MEANYLIRCKLFEYVKELYLDSNNIGEKGAQFISQGNFKDLKELSLNSNNIGDQGAQFISQGNFTNL